MKNRENMENLKGQRRSILSVVLSMSFIVLAVMMLLSTADAAVVVNDADGPRQLEGIFPQVAESPVSVSGGASNTYADGTLRYYLITQDASKAGQTEITYGGVQYPLQTVYVGSDIGAATPASFFAANSTVFFDSGTYNDSDGTNTVRFSATNLSLVGISGASRTKITKNALSDGTDARYIIAAKDVYLSGLTFDGAGRNMSTKTTGQYYFFISGGNPPSDSSAGFVMKDCTIQNVGASNSLFGSNKNIAINIYASKGRHDFSNLKFSNIKTQGTYGIISLSAATGNNFSDLTIDGSAASSSAYSFKIEHTDSAMTTAGMLHSDVSNVLSGAIGLSQTGNAKSLYIQDYAYTTVVPNTFRYAICATSNGGTSSNAISVSSTLPVPGSSKAVLDLDDGYWLVQDGASITATAQLATIKNVRSAIAGTTGASGPADIYLKIAADNGEIGGFTVPEFGDRQVHIVAVGATQGGYDSQALVPLKVGATVNMPMQYASRVRLYNFDFHKNLDLTLQEAAGGISPLPFLADPNEAFSLPGYPTYGTYGIVKQNLGGTTGLTNQNFVNCKFTSLARALEITSSIPHLFVGSHDETATAALTRSDDNSYTGADYTAGMRDTADDTEIGWFSSDPSVVSVDQTTGALVALGQGSAHITAKALDSHNRGEIEKPFAIFDLLVTDNRAPVVSDDSTSTFMNTIVDMDVLANDCDPDSSYGDSIRISSIMTPQHGTATMNADGTIRYTPADGYVGMDTFTYAVADDYGNQSSATVSVLVEAPVVPTRPTISVRSVKAGNRHVTGVATPGSTVEVTLPDGTKWSGVAGGDGHYDIEIPPQSTGALITVVATDSDGNVSDAVSVFVEKVAGGGGQTSDGTTATASSTTDGETSDTTTIMPRTGDSPYAILALVILLGSGAGILTIKYKR